MGTVKIDAATCVRAVTTHSECNSCVEVCPTDALLLTEQIPSIVPNDCVDCSACNAACPTSALSIDGFSEIDSFFGVINEQETTFSCKTNVPCLAALSVENLFAMANVASENIQCDSAYCEDCEIEDPLFEVIEENIETVNFLLEATLNDKRVEFTPLKLERDIQESEDKGVDRREFFRNFNLKSGLKAKQAFDQEVENQSDEAILNEVDNAGIVQIRNKQLPNRRKVLFSALNRIDEPETFHVLNSDDMPFTSIKEVDQDLCTNCQICYRICPTGALSSDHKFSIIDFNPFLCVKCHVCHDVCESDAITIKPTYNLEQLYKPTATRLAKFTVRKCHECDNYFTYQGGPVICPRCQVEEDEALTLWGKK
jgi:ferredoxin